MDFKLLLAKLLSEELNFILMALTLLLLLLQLALARFTKFVPVVTLFWFSEPFWVEICLVVEWIERLGILLAATSDDVDVAVDPLDRLLLVSFIRLEVVIICIASLQLEIDAEDTSVAGADSDGVVMWICSNC